MTTFQAAHLTSSVVTWGWAQAWRLLRAARIGVSGGPAPRGFAGFAGHPLFVLEVGVDHVQGGFLHLPLLPDPGGVVGQVLQVGELAAAPRPEVLGGGAYRPCGFRICRHFAHSRGCLSLQPPESPAATSRRTRLTPTGGPRRIRHRPVPGPRAGLALALPGRGKPWMVVTPGVVGHSTTACWPRCAAPPIVGMDFGLSKNGTGEGMHPGGHAPLCPDGPASASRPRRRPLDERGAPHDGAADRRSVPPPGGRASIAGRLSQRACSRRSRPRRRAIRPASGGLSPGWPGLRCVDTTR